MLDFIQLLRQRYLTALRHLDKDQPGRQTYLDHAAQLQYAEAFLRKGRLLAAHPGLPLQIAVIGPTQAGKSTTVNLLLGGNAAGVSPLAGYTVHPQGFCHGVDAAGLGGLDEYFIGFHRQDLAELDRGRPDCYALAPAPRAGGQLPACVLWDTPDFDSLDAADYREGLVRTLALADIVVLVVSKEKYADQSVWEVMRDLAGFHQPTLICLNKLEAGSEALVLQSLQDKWRQCRQEPLPDIVPLHFAGSGRIPVWPAGADRLPARLAGQVVRRQHARIGQQLLARHWTAWLEPVQAELHAGQHWQTLVDQSLAEALKHYRRDYLDHPHHYQTFQDALLNLLTLLEIPGLAGIMSKTRRVMTWPLRALLQRRPGGPGPTQELTVLNRLAEHVLVQLADRILEQNELNAGPPGWWPAAAAALRQTRAGLTLDFAMAAENYHRQFQPDVQAAAQRLYQRLQEQPAVLNSLRATRVTTDTAGILLAIQAGGIGVHDLLLTPLMLSITSLLAESAIGGYMARVEADLKQHQYQSVRRQLFDGLLRPRLEAVAQTDGPLRFNIGSAECRAAEQALREKKHGLRVL